MSSQSTRRLPHQGLPHSRHLWLSHTHIRHLRRSPTHVRHTTHVGHLWHTGNSTGLLVHSGDSTGRLLGNTGCPAILPASHSTTKGCRKRRRDGVRVSRRLPWTTGIAHRSLAASTTTTNASRFRLPWTPVIGSIASHVMFAPSRASLPRTVAFPCSEDWI